MEALAQLEEIAQHFNHSHETVACVRIISQLPRLIVDLEKGWSCEVRPSSVVPLGWDFLLIKMHEIGVEEYWLAVSYGSLVTGILHSIVEDLPFIISDIEAR